MLVELGSKELEERDAKEAVLNETLLGTSKLQEPIIFYLLIQGGTPRQTFNVVHSRRMDYKGIGTVVYDRV